MTSTPHNPVSGQSNLLLVYMPTAKCLGIDLDYMKPPSFESAAEEQAWQEQNYRDAKLLKLKLESGLIEAESMPGRIIFEPVRNKITAQQKERFVQEILACEDNIHFEGHVVTLANLMRYCIGLKGADVHGCLMALVQLRDIKCSKVMLLRQPESVDTIRRLRRYVGNLKLWNLSSWEERKFKANAVHIRNLSSTIYDNFKQVFKPQFDSQESFWEYYCERVQIYKEHVANISD